MTTNSVDQKKIRLLIAEKNPETRRVLLRLLGFEDDIDVVAETANGQDALDSAKALHPDVMVADVDLPILDGITLTQQVRELPIAVILCAVQGDDTQIIRKCMHAGARDLLVKPFQPNELTESIRRVYAEKKRTDLRQFPALTAARREEVRPRVIAFFSAKGGSGKTTIAVNVGALLAKRGIPTIVVDADVGFGGVRLHLNASSSRSIVDLLNADPPWSMDVIQDSIVRHEESGLNAILSPGMPEFVEAFHPEHFEHLLATLKERYRVILVDLPTVVSNPLLAILCLADDVVLVMTQDIVALKNTYYFRGLLTDPEKLAVATESVRYVLNQGIPAISPPLHPRELEKNFKIKFTGVLPTDDGVPLSIAKGLVLSVWAPASQWSESIRDLAEQLLQQVLPTPEHKRGLLERFRDIIIGKRTSLGGSR